MTSDLLIDAYTAFMCPECHEPIAAPWRYDGQPQDLPEVAAHWSENHDGPNDGFWARNEFDITPENPRGLTPCCGAFLTGTEDGLACRKCREVWLPL